MIVGGGPSGSSAAISILESVPGADVHIYEGRSFDGPERCAGGVNMLMMKKLGFNRLPSRVVQTAIVGAEVHSPSGYVWRLRGEYPGCVVDRNKFDRWLLDEAEKRGAEVHREWFRKPDRVYDYIIVADGAASRVSRILGVKQPSLMDIHMGVQVKCECDDLSDGVLRLYLGRRYAPFGYAWTFPARGGLVKVGLGVPLKYGYMCRSLLNRFVREIGAKPVEGMIAKMIPTAKPRSSNVLGTKHCAFLFVGDAGLWTDPATGGGIWQAIMSGVSAGKSVAMGKPHLYDEMMRWLRFRNTVHYVFKVAIFDASDRDLDKIVRSLSGYNPRRVKHIGTEIVKAVLWSSFRHSGIFRKLVSSFYKYMSGTGLYVG